MNSRKNIINFNYIDYIIQRYVNDLVYERHNVNLALFREALIHESAQESKNGNYNRLEFLGDSVFRLIMSKYLFERYDDENEGFLTKIRIRIECGGSMTELANMIGIKQFIIIDDPLTDDILEDVFEAFIGAFYINFGFKNTRSLVIALIEKHKDLASFIAFDDNYKDILLRYYHQRQWGHPTYQNKFVDNIYLSIVKTPDNKIIGQGLGATKNKAEQDASGKALIKLGVIKDNEVDDDWIDNIDKKKPKEKVQKKPLPIYNPHNILMDKSHIYKILRNYNIDINKQYKFNIKIFHEAMTHQSYVSRNKKIPKEDAELAKKSPPLQKKSNGRLKFLGNAMIHFIIAECLFYKYQDENEGFLTKLRSRIENRNMLFFLADSTKISKYVLVSQNIEILHGRNNKNILGAGFEAFVGALYLEFGFNTTRNFLAQVIKKELNIQEIASEDTNYKQTITMIFAKQGWGHPQFKLLEEEGPDHLKEFTMGLYYGKNLLGLGTARSIKKAEQIASKMAYDSYNRITQNT